MKKTENPEKNLLDMIPVVCCDWDTGEDGNVFLSVPRFRRPLMKKIALRMGKSEFVKVHLDEKGSKTWKRIDGKRSIEVIGKGLEMDEDESPQQFYERLSEYLMILSKNNFIKLIDT